MANNTHYFVVAASVGEDGKIYFSTSEVEFDFERPVWNEDEQEWERLSGEAEALDAEMTRLLENKLKA